MIEELFLIPKTDSTVTMFVFFTVRRFHFAVVLFSSVKLAKCWLFYFYLWSFFFKKNNYFFFLIKNIFYSLTLHPNYSFSSLFSSQLFLPDFSSRFPQFPFREEQSSKKEQKPTKQDTKQGLLSRLGNPHYFCNMLPWSVSQVSLPVISPGRWSSLTEHSDFFFNFSNTLRFQELFSKKAWYYNGKIPFCCFLIWILLHSYDQIIFFPKESITI